MKNKILLCSLLLLCFLMGCGETESSYTSEAVFEEESSPQETGTLISTADVSEEPTAVPTPVAGGSSVAVVEPSNASYVLNLNTGKFHYVSCSSVDSMNPENRQYVANSRDEILGMICPGTGENYNPCGRCDP